MQLLAARVGDQDLHEEAVELRFRQRVGALHLDGVLGGHHQEGAVQLVGSGAAGDGALLHGFEQRRLRFGGGAVDLVGQNQVGEDRTGLEAQRLGAVVAAFDHHAAHDIGGHEVGRELNAGVFQVQSPSQRAEQCGLAQPGDAFQKHMPRGQQANEDAFHNIVLPHDDFGDLPADSVEPVAGDLECRFGCHVSHCRALAIGRNPAEVVVFSQSPAGRWE